MAGLTKLSWNIYLLLAFAVGFIVNEGIHYFSDSGLQGISGYAAREPGDFLENENILIYPDKVVVKVIGAELSSYDSTGSMKPLLGEKANGIIVKPKTIGEIGVGDVISFRYSGEIIVHRIVSIVSDVDGIYFVTKGDNNF